MQNIVLIFAMQGEAAPLINSLAMHQINSPFQNEVPFELFQKESGCTRISLVTGGLDPETGIENVATVPATLMTYLAVEHLKPDILINCGTAGGIEKQGCRIGDVYLSREKFHFHDRRIPIPGYDAYGKGGYPSWDTSKIAAELDLKRGVISTGNSLDLLETDLRIIEESGAIIKDMEAAAIAWVCRTFSVPMFAVKSITDLIDHPTATATQFAKNFTLATERLNVTMGKILNSQTIIEM